MSTSIRTTYVRIHCVKGYLNRLDESRNPLEQLSEGPISETDFLLLASSME